MSTSTLNSQGLTQQEFPLLKPDGTVNWSAERRSGERSQFLRLNHQTVRDYAKRHAMANVDNIAYSELVDALLDEGTTSSMIGKWLNKTFERQSRDANNRFQVLQQSESLEDFFMRLEGHCAAHQANNDQRLTLLCSSITDNEIRRCVENYIAYQMPYDKIKESCLRDFGKSVVYWFLEEMDLTIKSNNVVKFARRLSTIVGYQTLKPIDREDKTCPWSIAMCKRLFMELPRPVAKEVMKI
jgi:hypothetical protein